MTLPRSWQAPPPRRIRRALVDKLGRPRGARWRGRLAVPQHAHPLVREFFGLVNSRKALLDEIAVPAGLSPCALKEWRRKNPTIVTFDAALGVVGYRLAIVAKEGV